MGTFKTSKLLDGNPALIPHISNAIEQEFKKDEFEVIIQDLVGGGKEISVTKGGIFKAIIGMKTALKIKLKPQEGNIQFDAGAGLWGLQVIPAAIALLISWPVILTQIYGLIQQSKLDDKALNIAEHEIHKNMEFKKKECKLCPRDNKYIPINAEYCPFCGEKV